MRKYFYDILLFAILNYFSKNAVVFLWYGRVYLFFIVPSNLLWCLHYILPRKMKIILRQIKIIAFYDCCFVLIICQASKQLFMIFHLFTACALLTMSQFLLSTTCKYYCLPLYLILSLSQ